MFFVAILMTSITKSVCTCQYEFMFTFAESKKEKKEKSSRKESKNLEKDTASASENQIEENDQESSPKSKKFGFFRVGGKKSKKSKHGSTGSLRRQSRDSDYFERSGSEFSLEESSGSIDSVTAGKPEASKKEVLNLNEKGELIKIESDSKASDETEVENAVLPESVSEQTNNSTVQPASIEDGGTDQTDAGQADGKDSSPKGDSLDDELQHEVFNDPIEKAANIVEQNTSPESSQVKALDFKEESFVSSSTKLRKEAEDTPSNRAEEGRKEIVTTHAEETSHYASLESERSQEVTLEDTKAVQELEITSSEGESVETVVSTGISTTADIGETTDETEKESLDKFDIEELMISTYKEKKGLLQDDRQDEAPEDKESIIHTVPNNSQRAQDQNKHQEDPGEEVGEFPKLDSSMEENLKQESKSHLEMTKREGGEKMSSARERNKVKESRKGRRIYDDLPEQFTSESSPFSDEKTGFISSTPKRSSVDIYKDTRKETKHGDLKLVGAGSIDEKPVKVESVVEFQLRVRIVSGIQEVKMSSKVLLAQLAEINEKLQELRCELLKVLESGKHEPEKAGTEEASVQT